ncbi:fumarylacetoacetate hydrolase family protein [uncultured Ramlibacter sp.]|uniref:fumarylacetoacetate hydrolase family protein n=1 Tax=uncultured Ramlibacter sp. TaxID=260755 RepID=UPI0026294710|nr:fumarylacetoacetate hydrolase family protein [uncultured Ramlibacter sp.]
MTSHWVRFMDGGTPRFGTVEGDAVRVCEGDMFAGASPTDRMLALAGLQLLAPVQPSKVLALWNNFHALGEKLKLDAPAEPLYLIKSPNSYLAPGGVIRKPACDGKVVFEGELGIVIGRTASQVSEQRALEHVFGYTCANDVTVADILNRDASFAQWVRAKGFDTFCPFGPVVATGLDPAQLTVRTILNGDVRQDYPISDMRFSVQQLVSLISQDMTLYPGDIILCGTSVGVGSMKPGSLVEVEIAGIGKLSNRFE